MHIKKTWRARNWKGGKTISIGYRRILLPDHHLANMKGYVLEHRYVAEKLIKRKLTSSDIVHHKNGNKLDNRPENLELTNRRDHFLHHFGGAPPIRVPTCRVTKTHKSCTKCLKLLPKSKFSKAKCISYGLRSACKICEIECKRKRDSFNGL